MNKKIMDTTVLLIILLFISAIAATIVYYNSLVSNENSKITSLNNEIANHDSQISNLTAQITNLTSVNIATALTIADTPYNPYNYLYINGSVTNTEEGTAYNAGLLVVAYDATGTLEINMTVPLVSAAATNVPEGIFGTDAAIDTWISSNLPLSSLQLGNLFGRQTATISINIYHEGTVSNWTVTPVWTNSP